MTTDNSNDNGNVHGMTSSQPYLIRAMYEWIVDNDLTPYLMVDASMRGTVVPEDYLDEKGRIILNISPNATSGLLMTNEEVTFSARFSGQSLGIVVPTYAVKAIYARENGQGMMFDETKEPETGSKRQRVQLEAVDNAAASAAGGVASTSVENADTKDAKPGDTVEKKPEVQSSGPGNNDDKRLKDVSSKKGKKGPHLKVIK